MVSLKKIPIRYIGELHNIKLINFSVDIEEIKYLIPENIKIREFEKGRALISMVNVQLNKMHPSFIPSFLHFGYQHVAFRLLVDDSKYYEGLKKGIFFLKSFSDKPWIVLGGGLFTDYHLEKAIIIDKGSSFTLTQGDKFIEYSISQNEPIIKKEGLKETVGALDRAYSILGNHIRVTEIQREKWPIEWIECTSFKTNFFKTAQFEGAFQVREMINYEWLPPKNI